MDIAKLEEGKKLYDRLKDTEKKLEQIKDYPPMQVTFGNFNSTVIQDRGILTAIYNVTVDLLEKDIEWLQLRIKNL
jgi:hypothetical protein